jgi:hypothetical protein
VSADEVVYAAGRLQVSKPFKSAGFLDVRVVELTRGLPLIAHDFPPGLEVSYSRELMAPQDPTHQQNPTFRASLFSSMRVRSDYLREWPGREQTWLPTAVRVNDLIEQSHLVPSSDQFFGNDGGAACGSAGASGPIAASLAGSTLTVVPARSWA